MAMVCRGCSSIVLPAKPLTDFVSANRNLVVVAVQGAPRAHRHHVQMVQESHDATEQKGAYLV